MAPGKQHRSNTAVKFRGPQALCAARVGLSLSPSAQCCPSSIFKLPSLIPGFCLSLREEAGSVLNQASFLFFPHKSQWVLELPRGLRPGLHMVKRDFKPLLFPGSYRQSMPAMRMATTHTASTGPRSVST